MQPLPSLAFRPQRAYFVPTSLESSRGQNNLAGERAVASAAISVRHSLTIFLSASGFRGFAMEVLCAH